MDIEVKAQDYDTGIYLGDWFDLPLDLATLSLQPTIPDEQWSSRSTKISYYFESYNPNVESEDEARLMFGNCQLQGHPNNAGKPVLAISQNSTDMLPSGWEGRRCRVVIEIRSNKPINIGYVMSITTGDTKKIALIRDIKAGKKTLEQVVDQLVADAVAK